MRSKNTRGFSLVELLIVMAVLLIVTGIASISIQPVLKAARVTNAYNSTVATLRQARERAVSTRWIYIVTFSNSATPNTIAITKQLDNSKVSTMQLPSDIKFAIQSGVPTTSSGSNCTPDCFGTASTPIDFDQGVSGGVKTQIYFYPDGSARDINGNLNNGVVYLSRPGELYSSRAITLWGATGRIRGWRLYKGSSGTSSWQQQ
ncbi:MAG: prepilin-type N-terminal cleavage/methylation domain-containing protein [Acidobacteria bacterium]|jgi:prepilin-type N-terminal cleavage/methylation domain-containing protein|nr:prepilin-type N-terminal cleavage/methylation domain-containing protein [Acidobacteriota bacterium]